MNIELFAIFLIILIGSGDMTKVNLTFLCHNRVCALFSNDPYHRREDLKALASKAVIKAGAHLDSICEEQYNQFNVSLDTNETSFFGNMFFAAIGCLSRCDFVLRLIGEISKRGSLTRDTRVDFMWAVIAIVEGVVILLGAVIQVAVMVIKRCFDRQKQNGEIEGNGSRSADWGTRTSNVQDADNRISTLSSESRAATPEEGHLTTTVEFCAAPMASQIALQLIKRHLSDAAGVHTFTIAQRSCARTHCASLSSVHEDMETNVTSDRAGIQGLSLDHNKVEHHTRGAESGDHHDIGPQPDTEPRSATPEEGDLLTAVKCCTPPTTSQVTLPQQKRYPSERDHHQHAESDQYNGGSPARIVKAVRVRQPHTEELGDTRSGTPEEGTECIATPTASQIALLPEIQYLLGAAGGPPLRSKPSLPGPHSCQGGGECGGAPNGAHRIGFTRSGVHNDHRKPKSAFAQTSGARTHCASQNSVHEERETSGRAGVHGLRLDYNKSQHRTRRVESGAPHTIGGYVIVPQSDPRSATPEESHLLTAAKCCASPMPSQVAVQPKKRNLGERAHLQHAEGDIRNRGAPTSIMETVCVPQPHIEKVTDPQSVISEQDTSAQGGAAPTASKFRSSFNFFHQLEANGGPPPLPKPSLPGHRYGALPQSDV